MQITVADIQKISVKSGETLVVFIDISNMSRSTAQAMMQSAAKFMRAGIADQSIQILVVPQTYSFGIIDPTQSNQIASHSIGGIGSGTGTPGDAFDRAMKGLG